MTGRQKERERKRAKETAYTMNRIMVVAGRKKAESQERNQNGKKHMRTRSIRIQTARSTCVFAMAKRRVESGTGAETKRIRIRDEVNIRAPVRLQTTAKQYLQNIAK